MTNRSKWKWIASATYRAAAISCLVLVGGCGPGGPGRTEESVSADRGATLYRDHGCPLCHGPAGAGDGPLAATLVTRPRDLRSPASYDKGTSALEVAATLAVGLPREGILVMQPYPHIPEGERLSIGLYVETLQTGASEEPGGATLSVSAGWARATPPGSSTTAAYLTIHNPGPDLVRLLGATTAAAETVEIHSMTMAEGRTSMVPQDELVLDPGATVGLEPGGVHLMLIGLAGPLIEGGSLELELVFSKGAAMGVVLPVRREAPGDPEPRHEGGQEDV